LVEFDETISIKLMKIVFTPIDNLIPIDLTIGKVYEGFSLDTQKHYYLLKNDKGDYYTYWKGNFTKLEEFRKNQIDEIISD
jgi:hypothetical protein